MKKILAFCIKEIVLTASFLLAVISIFFVPPGLEYIDYIDWRVLGILLDNALEAASGSKNKKVNFLSILIYYYYCKSIWNLVC